ncbi:DUF4345 family protein [Nocardioides sp.]|uniref:DUF4345 family protein n=1 Tax=Nocardioides sp. TaxID=35761 RepID=UPI00356B2F6E
MNKPLAFGALSYAAVGVAGLVAPERIPALFGGTAATPASRTEIRAVYGGFPLAAALTTVLTPARVGLPFGLMTAGMAAGRVAGAALEGEVDGTTKFFVALETAMAAAFLVGGITANRPVRTTA